MQTFIWGEEFYTGLGLVDEQHHALVDLFNALSECLEASIEVGEAKVQLAFSELMDYTKYHFSAEADLMRQASLDPRYVSMHLSLHGEFAMQVSAMWSARASMSHPADLFLSFLTGWLCSHVLGVDQAMARQLDLVGRGETPEHAYELELARPKDKAAEAMIKALRNTYQVVSRLNLELIAANLTLERRVIERTAELQKSNEALVLANRQLEVYSHTDGLLGIANRSYFDSRLREEWKRALREQTPLSILMIDVDFFKCYNDHYGHQAGDACLQAVAQAASGRMVRAIDLLARYGGEEFVVLLPGTLLQGAHKVAVGICEAVSALNLPHVLSSVADHVTVSAGAAALFPDCETSPEQLVEAADQALYAAKQQGRNRVCTA